MNPIQVEHGEALFRLIFEQASVGVCVFDLEGRVVRANPACCRLSDWTEAELVGRHWSDFTHPEDVPSETLLVQSLARGQATTYTLRKRFLGRRGEAIWTEVTVSVLRDSEGKPTCFLAVVLDWQDAYQTELALRQSEQHVRSLVDNTPDGIARLDDLNRILFMNQAMGRILEVDPDRSRGRTLSELGRPEWEVPGSGEPTEMEVEWRGRYYDWRLIPEPDASGAGTVLSLLRDVTAVRQAREARKQRLLLAERLDAVSLALAKAGLDARCALDAIAEFAATFIGEMCFITLLSEDQSFLESAAFFHPDPELARLAQELLQSAPFDARGQVFARVVGQAEPVLIPEVQEDFLRSVLRPEHQRFLDIYRVHSLLAVPMRADQRVLGAVTLVRGTAGRPYRKEDQALVQEFADRAALTLVSARLYAENLAQAEALRQSNRELEQRVAERTRELEQANGQLQQMATHDALTGLFNRRQFDLTLETEVRRTRHENRWLSLLMLDIDFFKRYNDLYGHQAGDRCLQQVAEILRKSFRRGADLAARYGGEEFVVILPDTDAERAFRVAEKVRLAIGARALPHAASDVAPYVTASLGCVSMRSGQSGLETTPDELVRRADAALYASKAGGRNRVTRYTPDLDQ